MRTFVKEIAGHLTDGLIPFWEKLKDTEYGGYYGTWYYSTGKHIESAMKEGTVEIENEGLDFYTINATFKDGYGHQVKASYSGKLLFATVEY